MTDAEITQALAKFMGWTKDYDWWQPLTYETDAFQVVDKMEKLGWDFELKERSQPHKIYQPITVFLTSVSAREPGQVWASGNDRRYAIAEAVLKAIGEWKE